MPLTPDHLNRATDQSIAAMAAAEAADWTGPAQGLSWTCLATAEHIASCHVGYALLITGRCTDSYLPFDLVLDEGTKPRQLLTGLHGTAALLAAAIDSAPGDLVVWHPYGMADLAAVAGMGAIETLVHTWDITQALGVPFAPENQLCADILARMFPEVDPDDDAWQGLLWATGRVARADQPRRTGWRWTNDLSAIR